MYQFAPISPNRQVNSFSAMPMNAGSLPQMQNPGPQQSAQAGKLSQPTATGQAFNKGFADQLQTNVAQASATADQAAAAAGNPVAQSALAAPASAAATAAPATGASATGSPLDAGMSAAMAQNPILGSMFGGASVTPAAGSAVAAGATGIAGKSPGLSILSSLFG